MDKNPLSYINHHTIQGMVSERYKSFENGFKKNKNNIVLFYPALNIKDFNEKNIYINYLLEDEYNNIISSGIDLKKSKQKMILSQIDNDFLLLKGNKYHEFRETKNKYDKIISIKNVPNSIDDVLNLIKVWDEISGIKYGWQRHSGYDRNFFCNIWSQEKDQLFSYFFYLEDKLVGYSIISKLGNGENFNYIIRKNNTSYRNLCLYIDLKSFSLMFDELQKPFTINWGAASGNILKYKKKFPIYKEIPVYFAKVIK